MRPGAIERLRRMFGGGLTLSADETRLRATRHALFLAVAVLPCLGATVLAEPFARNSIGRVITAAMMLIGLVLGLHTSSFSADRTTGRWRRSGRWLGFELQRTEGTFDELRFVRLRAITSKSRGTTRTSYRLEVAVKGRDLEVLRYWTRNRPSDACLHEAQTLAAFMGVPLRRSSEGPWGALCEGPDEHVAMPRRRPPQGLPYPTIGALLVYLPLPYMIAPGLLAAPLVIAEAVGDTTRIFAWRYEDALAILAPCVAGLTLAAVRSAQAVRMLEAGGPRNSFARKAMPVLFGLAVALVVFYDVVLDPVDLHEHRWARRPWHALHAMSSFAVLDFLIVIYLVPMSIASALGDRQS